MADLLVKHLKEKGNEHSALGMLVSQWGFDEQLIPKALQSVGNLFPHYSRHDESHSKQILVNVERLLGDNISLLTATDTWLLLESAYWHDIGMVVPHDEIAKTLKDPAFGRYLNRFCTAPHHELHRLAESLRKHDISAYFAGMDTPLEGVERFRQLMAEWFRQKHAERAEYIVQAPGPTTGISSPRTELIPARLFRLLGRICHIHGLPFASLFTGLPFKEAGMAQEDCHPRFIACLLRMGDLLDLDDNRFCPVMQRIVGEDRPRLSRAHEDKHAGVRHLRIDRERIEVTAECTTIEGYLETFKWFDWLKQEMQAQMANWQDIVPNRQLGLLPTLGDIGVRLAGELRILREGQRPQFSVDDDQATLLLQGRNLYTDRFSFVRELLQNAVDATCLRLWLTEAKKLAAEDWQNPFAPKVREILRSLPVEVVLAEEPSVDGEVKEHSTWTLTITDQGTGISQADLVHMMRIGGSQKNVERQAIIDTMPEWLKPSGAFGIGFQSVFLLCDEVTFITKSIISNETLQVTMYSPTGDKEGLVLLRRLENDISRPYGTSIRVPLQLETFASPWSTYGVNQSISSQFVRSLDPVLDTKFPLHAAQLADRIGEFSRECPIGIEGEFRSDAVTLGMSVTTQSKTLAAPALDWQFVRANGHELAIALELPGYWVEPHSGIKAWFRGQQFSCHEFWLPFARLRVNILSGKANTWLTANRENVSSTAGDMFYSTVLAAVEAQVRKDLDNAGDHERLDRYGRDKYSLFLQAMAMRFGGRWTGLAKELDKQWLDLQIPKISKTYRDFIENSSSWVLGEKSVYGNYQDPPECDVLAGSQWSSSLFQLILNEWLKDRANTVHVMATPQEDDDGPTQPIRCSLKKEPQPLYAPGALAQRLLHLARSASGNRRYVLNCAAPWNRLSVKSYANVWAFRVFEVPWCNPNFVLLPFLFRSGDDHNEPRSIICEDNRLDALCRWVEPRLKTPATLADIRKTYLEFIEYIDLEIMRPSDYWDSWKELRRL